ncbi:probable purine permease 5 [Phragmites australis]|uniref:probable purine permease 5 n=1 Tax=Phragmites australis TaxID=29695 RepID=UPI002D78541B|nr:probable purine permease 5 [Phragmites australis]
MEKHRGADTDSSLHQNIIRVSSPVAMEEGTSEPNHSLSLHKKTSEVIAATLETYRSKPLSFWLLLVLSSGAMLTAFPASSLLSRLYYNNGGQSKWILSWAAVAGWPLPALFLLPFYLLGKASPTPLSLALCFWYVLLGFLSAADNLMYAWAYAYLPASTASLVAASSLAFSALFGRAIVKNRLTLSSLNAVVVITAGVVIVALDSGSDRPPGVTARQYALGFVLDVLGSALHGLIFALSELVFAKILGRRSFHVVLEQQAAVSLSAFAFTSVGLAISEGFPAMRREASRFKHGEAAYANVMVWTAVTFQLGVLGGTGVLFLASTVLAGVLNAVRVPLTSVAAVIWFHDPMSGFKILALVITVWGFASYMVGHSSAKSTSSS